MLRVWLMLERSKFWTYNESTQSQMAYKCCSNTGLYTPCSRGKLTIEYLKYGKQYNDCKNTVENNMTSETNKKNVITLTNLISIACPSPRCLWVIFVKTIYGEILLYFQWLEFEILKERKKPNKNLKEPKVMTIMIVININKNGENSGWSILFLAQGR